MTFDFSVNSHIPAPEPQLNGVITTTKTIRTTATMPITMRPTITPINRSDHNFDFSVNSHIPAPEPQVNGTITITT